MDRTPATTLYKCAPSCDSQDPFLSDLRTACCGSGAVSESELANRTKAKPRGQHRKFSRRCPRLADTRIGLAGQAIRCRRSFFFLSVHWVVCTFTRQRPSARAEGSAKAAAAAAICTKLHEALENFAIRNRQTACPARAGQASGLAQHVQISKRLCHFFGSLPSGALVHLAVFSPSAALAGLSWLINRSLPIFMLRLASSSPTLGAPRHRERARACRRTIHCLQCEPLPCTRSCRLPRRPSRRTSSLARTTRDRVCDMKSKQSAPLQLSVGDHGGR